MSDQHEARSRRLDAARVVVTVVVTAAVLGTDPGSSAPPIRIVPQRLAVDPAEDGVQLRHAQLRLDQPLFGRTDAPGGPVGRIAWQAQPGGPRQPGGRHIANTRRLHR